VGLVNDIALFNPIFWYYLMPTAYRQVSLGVQMSIQPETLIRYQVTYYGTE